MSNVGLDRDDDFCARGTMDFDVGQLSKRIRTCGPITDGFHRWEGMRNEKTPHNFTDLLQTFTGRVQTAPRQSSVVLFLMLNPKILLSTGPPQIKI